MRQYLGAVGGGYRFLRNGTAIAVAFWALALPTLVAAIHPPVVVVLLGIPLGWVGMVVIVAFAVGARYVFLRPLRRRVAELSTANNAVFCVTLDPLWMPLEGSSSGPLGIGFLIVGREGIRVVDPTDREILVATWDEVAAIRRNRAPRPVAEFELHRAGEVTVWWFSVLGPAAFLRRGSKGIDRFVEQVRARIPVVAEDDAPRR